MDKVELDGVYKEHIFKYLKEKSIWRPRETDREF